MNLEERLLLAAKAYRELDAVRSDYGGAAWRLMERIEKHIATELLPDRDSDRGEPTEAEIAEARQALEPEE